MRSKEIEERKKTLSLTTRQRGILAGLLLGDGHLESQNGGRTYRLKVAQSFEHKEYVDWLYKEFAPFVRTPPRKRWRKAFGQTYEGYEFQTLSCGAFRFYGQQFYRADSGEKSIPVRIGKMLTPLSLAVWFMDDGAIKSRKHRSLVIHTQGFSKKDLQFLGKVLQEKFKIESTLQAARGRWRLYIVGASIPRFLELVLEYLLPSMKYKLGINTMPKE